MFSLKNPPLPLVSTYISVNMCLLVCYWSLLILMPHRCKEHEPCLYVLIQ